MGYYFENNNKINTFQHLIIMIYNYLKSYQQRINYLIFYINFFYYYKQL